MNKKIKKVRRRIDRGNLMNTIIFFINWLIIIILISNDLVFKIGLIYILTMIFIQLRDEWW